MAYTLEESMCMVEDVLSTEEAMVFASQTGVRRPKAFRASVRALSLNRNESFVNDHGN